MSALARFLMNAFGQLVTSISLLVSAKVAVGGAAIAVSLVLLTAFYVAMKLLVLGLTFTISNQYLLMGFYMIWPSNAELCISIYWTARLTLFLYREYRANVRLAAYVT
jgi:hypothetical protein